MHPAEVAVRELVPALRLLAHLVVDAEIPPGVLPPAVLLEVLVLPVRGRRVFAPVVTLVLAALPLRDQVLGVLEGILVQGDAHRSSSGRVTGAPGRVSANPDQGLAQQ